MSSDARAKALIELSRFQVAETTVRDSLQRISEIALEAMPRAAVVGMTMLGEDERPTTAIYTDPDSPEIDEAQYREGRGPCLDAWRENCLIRVDHVDDVESEFPAFAMACRQHGVASTLSLPMQSGGSAIGAMNLYAREQEAFSPEDEDVGTDLAAAAGSVLANVSAYWTAFDLGQQLDAAMKSRAVIEQAKGMLMARSPQLGADEAFDMLRKASQRENVKLRDIAQRLVDRQAPPGPAAERG